jgi:ribonuclease J
MYIHSLSEPFNEEMELSAQRMRNWLDFFGVRYVQSHCSGHMCGDDLKEVVAQVKPKVLFPIHTEHPGMFRGVSGKAVMVKEEKKYEV